MIITITMVKEKFAKEILEKIGGESVRIYDDKYDIQFKNVKGLSVEINPRYLILSRRNETVKITASSYHGLHMIKDLGKFMNPPE